MTLTPLEVARAEEARQALGTAEVAAVAEPIAGGWMAFDGPGSWANQAAGLGLSGAVSPEELDALVAFYVSRGVEPRIEVCPFAHESLIHGLGALGFRLLEFESVLCFDLAQPVVFQRSWPEGATVTRIDPHDDPLALRWAEVSTSGFRDLDEPLSEAEASITLKVLRHPRSAGFAAWVDGELVGAAGMETAGDAACLFGASVLEPYRNRGIQGALIATRLDHARDSGARFACIHSRPGIPTERNALRLGFTVVYTKVVMAMPGAGLLQSP